MDNSMFLSSLGQTAKNLFTLPSIGMPVLSDAISKVTSLLNVFGLERGIPIFSYSQKEIGKNNIGEQIMLRTLLNGTAVITDNIAPLPREWLIEGYISNPFPISNSWENFVTSQMNSVVMVQSIKNYFRFLRTLRTPFRFISKDGEGVDVLMQEYTFIEEPESEWATKVSMHLKEYVALSISPLGSTLSNAPVLGGIFGQSAQLPAQAAKTVASSVLKGFIKT